MIEIKPITSEWVVPAAQCFSESFQREPIVSTLQILPDAFFGFAQANCAKAAAEGMGVVAIDTEKGVLAGLSLLIDMADQPVVPDDTPEKLDIVFTLLGELQAMYFQDFGRPRPRQVVELFITGILKAYERHDVATRLIQAQVELARKYGYSAMITEATSTLSQNKGKRRFGFKELYTVDYNKFIYKGQAVFKDVDFTNSPNCKLMILDLGASSPAISIISRA